MPAFLMWPAIKLFFGSALSTVWAALKSFFSALNAQGWIGLIGCALLMVGFVHQWSEARHWHKQSDRYEKLYNADEAAARKVAADAVALKAKIDALSAHISQTLKEQHDAQDARIAADADAVRLRGPGKAACPGNPGSPSASGGHQQASPAAPDAGSQMPASDRAAVPWDWLVQLTEEHDQLLNEARTWRENDRKQRAARDGEK